MRRARRSRTCRRAAAFDAGRHGRRRRRDHRVHVRHDRRAEGLRALPPRPAGVVRHVRARTSCDPQPSDVFSGTPPLAFTFGLGALVLFPLRFGASTAPTSPAGELLDTLARAAASRRCSPRRPRTARCSREDVAGLAAHVRVARASRCPAGVSDAWFEKTGIRIVDGIGSTEMLHIFIASPAARGAARLVRAAGARATRRGSSTTTCETLAAGRGRQARRARPDRLPLPRRPAPGDLRARRLEPHRRRVLDGRRRLLLVPGAHRRHDHLLGLQHLAASRSRPRCSSTRSSPSARWSRRPTRSAGTS